MLNDAPRRMPPEKILPARRLFFDPFFRGDVKQQLYIDGSYGFTTFLAGAMNVHIKTNH